MTFFNEFAKIAQKNFKKTLRAIEKFTNLLYNKMEYKIFEDQSFGERKRRVFLRVVVNENGIGCPLLPEGMVLDL